MSNVFENGLTDTRQSEDACVKPEHCLFRKRYRQMTPEEVTLHDAIKDKADELVNLIQAVGGDYNPHPNRDVGANKQLAIRHLEDCVYRAVKALTA